MKIALLVPFPARSHSAERELIARCVDTLPRLGHAAVALCSSDEVIRHDPDFVIITSPLVPKLTQHYTVGLLWSPTPLYDGERDQEAAIRSWDLVVPINATARRFARDAHFPVRHAQAVSELDFYPSAPLTSFPIRPPDALSLACIGLQPPSLRQQRMFEALAAGVDLHVYGAPAAWTFLPDNYRGAVPFAPDAVAAVLNRHGAVLAPHKTSHADEDMPGMQVFEGCAANCLVITDRLPSLQAMFGDSLCYVDMSRTPREAAQEVADILSHCKQNPDWYFRKVSEAQAAFRAGPCLDRLLERLVADVRSRLQTALAPGPADGPSVSVIIRCGGRPLAMVRRAVNSVLAQTHGDIGIIFVRFAPIEGFADWLEQLRGGGRLLFAREIFCDGQGLRSRTLWAGFRAVETALFCTLDDDDALFPNHIAGLVAVLRDHPDVALAYTGVVRQEEDGVLLNQHPRFAGDLDVVVAERRRLEKFDDFDLERLLRGDCFIQSNAWLARREVLTPAVLEDPELAVSEDWYFYLLLASRHRLLFSGTATALWNWRSMAGDNSLNAVGRAVWDECVQRVRKRLAHVPFPSLQLGTVVARRGVAAEVAPVVAGLWGAIDFAEVRLPWLVVKWSGISGPEHFGRWSDAKEVMLKFRQALPARFMLRVKGYAFGKNCGMRIGVTVGEARQAMVLEGDEAGAWVEVAFENPDGADTLRFSIPHPEAPATRWPGRSYDVRLLGVALMRLEVVEVGEASGGSRSDRRWLAGVKQAFWVFVKKGNALTVH